MPCAQELGHLSCHLQGQARTEGNQSQVEQEQTEKSDGIRLSHNPSPLPPLTTRRKGQRDRITKELREQGHSKVTEVSLGSQDENFHVQSSLFWSASVSKAPCSPFMAPFSLTRLPWRFPSCTPFPDRCRVCSLPFQHLNSAPVLV